MPVNGDTISSEKSEEEYCRYDDIDEGAGVSDELDSECDDGRDSDENG
jgi:hypothetical protein